MCLFSCDPVVAFLCIAWLLHQWHLNWHDWRNTLPCGWTGTALALARSTGSARGFRRGGWDECSMPTERGCEEASTRRTPQQQPRKGREDDWQEYLESFQGFRAELLLGFRPRTRNTRLRSRSGRPLQTSNDVGLGQRNRDHCSAHIKDGDSIILNDVEPMRERPVVPHSSERQVTEACPGHHRIPWLVIQEHAAKSSAHDVGAGRCHPLVSERKGCRTGRSLRWAVQDRTQRLSRPATETARYHRLYLEEGWKCRSSGNVSSSWYSTERRIRARKLQGYFAGSARREDTAQDHRSPPQWLRERGDPAEGIEWFPSEPSYHRYDVRESSATGVGAEETNFVECTSRSVFRSNGRVIYFSSRLWVLVLRLMRRSRWGVGSCGSGCWLHWLRPLYHVFGPTSTIARLSLSVPLLSILVPVPVLAPVPFPPPSLSSCPFPFSLSFQSSLLSLFLSSGLPSRPWCPVLHLVSHRRAGAGSCAQSCWLPAGATSCIHRQCRIRNGSTWSSTLLLSWCGGYQSSPPSLSLLHLRSRSRIRSSPRSRLRCFPHFLPRSHSRLVFVLSFLHPSPFPLPMPFPSSFAFPRLSDPVTSSVQRACTGTGLCERSCWATASAPPGLQRWRRVRNGRTYNPPRVCCFNI